MNIKEFSAFKKKAMKFKVQDNHFFCQNSKNVQMHQTVNNLIEWQTIFLQLHNESGYKGHEGTYWRVADRYWYDNLHVEIKAYEQLYEECQRCNPSWFEEALHLTWVAVLWQKVSFDVVYMPPCKDYQFFVVAHYNLSGWVEAKPLRIFFSRAVADLL